MSIMASCDQEAIREVTDVVRSGPNPMLILILILISLTIGVLALLSVAASGSIEGEDAHPWLVGPIVILGVATMILALALLATAISIAVVGRGLTDDNLPNFIACALGVLLFGPLGVLLVLLPISMKDRSSSSLLWRPKLLRRLIAGLGYLLACGVPALIFPPLTGLLPGAMFTALAYLRRRRESYLLWLLTIAVERKLPLAPELSATGFAMGGRAGAQLMGVAERLEDGESLGRALAHRDSLVPPPDALAARVGEQTGTLAQTLRDAAQRVNGSSGQSQQTVYLTGILTYVWMVALLFAGIIGFCMYYIVPKYKAIFEDFDVELPEASLLLIEVSNLVVSWWFLGVPLILTALLATIFAGEVFRRGWRSLSLNWLTHWFPRLDTPDILRNLSRAVQTGTPLPPVLETLADHHHREHIRERLQRVLVEIERGHDPWDSLRQNRLLRTREVELLHASEVAGNLDWALRDVAERIDRDRSHRWQWWFEVLRPWPILILALMAAFFAVGMFLPLIRLLNELS
ncbi:MAG: type II secretion system F family protein [Planctomycetaceae bacterium]